ncbi:MAG TPA: helix-turn-helix transcriptional regulator [Solirubrobacterales bacterium]|nr:helix-turn-helix transcriptional regulator [Solirubrobacterales bacterium]
MAGRLLANMLRRSGLSQAELSRRAGIPRSVLNAYLHGAREPGSATLAKLASAAGFELSLAERQPPVDAERAGRILVQVLDLAEALPYRPRAEIETPPLAHRLSERAP